MNDARTPQNDVPQLRTLLLTDLCDSTELIEKLGDARAAELFRDHDALVLRLQQAWRGRLIDRSDGLLLVFERPIDGLGFALDYQRGLDDLGRTRQVPLRARAGLHVGEVLTWRNSDEAVQIGAKPLEVEGLAKPMAARLMAIARPGQILLSAVAESLTHRAARELGQRGEQLVWKSYGRWRFKGVPTAMEIYEVGEVGRAQLRTPKASPKAWRDIPLWRRPAALVAEVALVAVIGVGAWLVTRPEPALAFAERDWVVVGDMRNLTGDPLLDDSLQQAFRISLEQSRYVNVLSDMKVRNTLGLMRLPQDTGIDRALGAQIALREGARALILPTVAEVGGRVRISAEIVDPATQTTVYVESADGRGAGSVLASIDQVTASLRESFGEATASIRDSSAPLPQVTTGDLDALRAYAIGQDSFNHAAYEEAEGYYERAIQLDPQFALAHIGLLRTANARDDLEAGVEHLDRALAHRDRLSSKDRLYLDAWTARVREPQQELALWKQMSRLYPDDFPSAMNTAYRMYTENRYEEGRAFAAAAANPKNPAFAQAERLYADYLLSLGELAGAEKAYRSAAAAGIGAAKVRLADLHATRGDFEAARAGLASVRVPEGSAVRFDEISVELDSGRWREARRLAQEYQGFPRQGTQRRRQVLYPLAVTQWVADEPDQARATLAQLTTQSLAAMADPRNRQGAAEDAYVAASAALLAQRMGDTALVPNTLRALKAAPDVAATSPVAEMITVLEAATALQVADAQRAIALLRPLTDRNAPYQARVWLLKAYLAAGDVGSAEQVADWLAANKGQAYAEEGCGWCQQPLNVVDLALTPLIVAEKAAALGLKEQAKSQLARFDARWPAAALSPYLRERRRSLGAFN